MSGAPCQRREDRGGVLVVDKPKGPTSHDVVARLRRALKTRQIGHSGTLDPMATGVLVAAVGEATKLVPWLTSDDKAYEATLRLGVATDTLDAEGRDTDRREVDDELLGELSDVARGRVPARLEAAIEAERARAEQTPPAFSAIKIAGERAHALARRGQVPELGPRSVEIRRIAIVGGGPLPEPHLDLSLEVGKGYFVRALARDLAARLGTVGHLAALRRTRSGAFGLDDAVPLDAPDLGSRVIPLARAASRAMPTSNLTDAGALAASRGQRIRPEDLADPHPRPSAWLDREGRLVAIGEVQADGSGRVLRGFSASRPG